MNKTLNATHSPSLRSWVVSANEAGCDFPIQNLPFGRFRPAGSGEALRIGIAIGDQVLDLQAAGLVDTDDMNALMARGPAERLALRAAISAGLAEGSSQQSAWAKALWAQSTVELGLPCQIGDYTDFYTSIHHATTIGKQLRPDNPLLPNYKWVPIGYHGRASSIQPGGGFHRPNGQTKAPDQEVPSFGPCRRLDYELELGMVIGRPNALGHPIPMAQAEDHVFGVALFNDWSARDVQGWEYQPLGPFLSKNFVSTLSPWVVTLDALAPFRSPFNRPEGDPAPLPYLASPSNTAQGAIDIELEVWLQTEQMRAAGHAGDKLSQSNYRDAYWSVAQLVAHHTVNGCNLRAGDLFGTGTLSGPNPEQGGSLMELSAGGKKPFTLSSGETLTYLEDGDTVILRGYCARAGYRRIGFGECRGTVLPGLSP
jgi:fumarylacetoacetase